MNIMKSHTASRRSFLLSTAMFVTSTIAGCALPTIPLPEVTSPAGLEPMTPPPPNPTATSAIEKTAAVQSALPPYTIAPIAGHEALVLNLTTQDLRLHEFFQQREVRIALSLAVNRAAINEILFNNSLIARQYSPLSTSPHYHETLSNAHTVYNPEQAITLLELAGYTERDVNGYFVWPGTRYPNHEPIMFFLDTPIKYNTASGNAIELIVSDLGSIGIRAVYRPIEQSIYEERRNANEIDATWLSSDSAANFGFSTSVFTGTDIYYPWCPAWTLWRNSKGTDPNGEAPPEGHWIYTIWSRWEQIERERDPAHRDLLFRQILDIWAEELPMIGYLGPA